MRVPIGSPCLLISTAALRSKRMLEPSARRTSFAVRTTTARVTSPLFTLPPGTAEHADALYPPSAGVVGDVQVGLDLDHVRLPFSCVVARHALSASTSQRLRFEIGRHSRILTLSPVLRLSVSSCAMYFFVRLMNFL